MIHYVLGILIGIYIMFEAIHQMGEMPGGDRACRVAKYVLAALSGLVLIWHGWHLHLDWLHVALSTTIGLFLWPKMLGRIRAVFKFERRQLDRRT